MEFGGVFHLTQYAAEPLAPYAGLPTLGVQACLVYSWGARLALPEFTYSCELSQGKP